jgi:DNA-directed RNA polymerase specialized sigma24 family protein
MEHLPKLKLLNEHGQPLNARIHAALEQLLPRFQREFPGLGDAWLLAETFEKAGRRIARREQCDGPIENLPAYAWKALRNVARSWLRRGANRVHSRTLPSEKSEAVLATIPASVGTPQQIEEEILMREIFERLTLEECLVCHWKKAGYSSQQIAEFRGSSVAATDMFVSRLRAKIRRFVGVQDKKKPGSRSSNV